jgi:hypothetical protein
VRVVAESTPDNGNIADNFHIFAESSVACNGGDVSGNLPLIFDENAASEGGGVAGDLTSNTNAAANAGDVANLFAGANADIVAELSAVSFGRGKRDGRQSEEAGGSRAQQSVAEDATHRAHHKDLRLNPVPKRNYGTSAAQLVSVQLSGILYNGRFSKHTGTSGEETDDGGLL